MVENLPGECWRQINRNTKYPYFISSEGRVKVKDATGETLVKLYHNYKSNLSIADSVNLHYLDKGIKNTNLSTLVAEAFIPGYNSNIHYVKRINTRKGWQLSNMERADRAGSRLEKKPTPTIQDARPIPKTEGLYKITKDGTVFYTPTKQALPAIEVSGRKFVELELPGGSPRYQDINMLVAQIWGGESAQHKDTKTKQTKTTDNGGQIEMELSEVKTKKHASVKSGRTITVMVSGDALGQATMSVGEAANLLGVGTKTLQNRLYNHLRYDYTLCGEKVRVEYPDMVGREPYFPMGDGKAKNTGRIRNMDTGRSYNNFYTFAKDADKYLHRTTLLHHLGRFGAVKVKDTVFKLESLLEAEAVDITGRKHKLGQNTKAKVEPVAKTEEKPIEKAEIDFDTAVLETLQKLSSQAKTKNDFFTLAGMINAMKKPNE